MKIAFILGRFPALSETFILNQIAGLLDRGHEVHIYADPPVDARAHDEVAQYELSARTHYAPTMPRNPAVRLLKGLALIAAHGWKDPRKVLMALHIGRYGRAASSLRLLFAVVPFVGRPGVQYDVLHCHFGVYGVRGMFLREVGALNGKLVTTFHAADLTQDISRQGKRVQHRLLATGDLFLTISEMGRRELLIRGCPAERVSVHRMGIACRRIAFHPRSRPDSEPVRFASACRLVEKKGIEYGIRAVARLAASAPGVRYDIVGDGPLREPLERLVAELGLSGVVTLHGWKTQSELLSMIDSAHVFLAPSVTTSDGDHEGIPVSLMEAMASGLPVISTRHSGIPELIEESKSGLLADERDVDALTEQMLVLLENASWWPKLTAAARERVERHFDVDSLNDRLVELLEDLCQGGRPLNERAINAGPVASTGIGG